MPSTPFGSMTDFDIIILPPASILAAEFADIGLQVKSFREPLKRSIQGVVAPRIRLNFDVGGIPPWAPLADYTVDEKERLGYPPDILIRTGKLRRVAGQLNIWTITPDEAYVSNLPGAEYGYFHEGGTRFMPMREFLTFDGSEDEVAEVFANWVIERFANRGFSVPSGFGAIFNEVE